MTAVLTRMGAPFDGWILACPAVFLYLAPMRRLVVLTGVLAAAVALTADAHRCGRAMAAAEPFRNPDLSDDQRLEDLVGRLTLDEKIAALGTDPAVPRLGIRGARHVEGLHGLAYGGPSNWGSRNPMPTTIFPQAVGLAMTWDVSAVRTVAALEGYEARFIFQSPKWSRGGLIVRAPNADLARDIRWGRTEESYGEDPFLAGTLTQAFVKGLQGEHPRYWQAASLLKHLLANSNEDGREHTSSNLDARLLREYYSVPFRMGISGAHANAFMAAYNRINGVPATVQPLLRSMTMAEWGLDGIICTDGGALGLLVTAHKYFPGLDQAAAASIKAGITVFLDKYAEAVRDALRKGLITEREIDEAVTRNFRISLRLGLLDPPERVPYARIGLEGADPWTTDQNKRDVREITRRSIVLLKNAGLLPLDASRLKSAAVIGPHADEVLLDWYSGTPPYTVSPLQGIRNRLGDRATVSYVTDDPAAAAKLARESDVAIVVVGNHPTCGGAEWAKCPVGSDGREAVDRRSITLEQESSLVQRVFEANPRTVVVLRTSFPYTINWTDQHVPAIVTMAHGSQEEGNALADVLFGDYNPAGRLVHTWPRSIDQLPPMMDYDIRHGRTYMYFRGTPLYPFGYGLSYTGFAYTSLRTSAREMPADGEIAVEVDVKNTGARTGDEVVQLYVSYPESHVSRPGKELKGFQRVTIGAGEVRKVRFTLRADQLAWWDDTRHAFVVEPGSVRIRAGGSSADDRLTTTVRIRGM
jgi:beta-glucosidase